jgi:hypothetical protein
MLINVIDAADLKLCLPLPSFFAGEGGNPRYAGVGPFHAAREGTQTIWFLPTISGYSRAREYAESGSAVSRFLITVLR